MSEPVTNVEIEDVLSSIRKLVSDGDKARTRDPAPAASPDVTPQDKVAQQVKDATARIEDPKTDKLVLTPALMVVESDMIPHETAQTPEPANDPQADADASQDDVATDPVPAQDPEADPEPVQLTEMVWDADEPEAEADAASSEDRRFPDRSELVATIAELEAAIAKDAQEFEPDGSELKAEMIEWPSPKSRSFDDIEDAETSDVSSFEDAAFEDVPQADDLPEDSTLEDDDQPFEFVHQSRDVPQASPETDADTQDLHVGASAEAETVEDVYEDDDLDDLLDDDTAGLDEEALRVLVADVVREELTGPLGEKITRNVRKLVRREIYRILSSKEFD